MKRKANWRIERIDVGETDVDFILGCKVEEIVVRVSVETLTDAIGRFFDGMAEDEADTRAFVSDVHPRGGK